MKKGDSPYGDYKEILNRVDKFTKTKFPHGLKNIPEKIILYRLLNVADEEDINKNKLGKSYVGDKSMYEDIDFLESFLFRYGEEQKKWFIVTVETSKDNINIGQTLGIIAEYPDEIEFTIINDENLKILNIEEFDNTNYI